MTENHSIFCQSSRKSEKGEYSNWLSLCDVFHFSPLDYTVTGSGIAPIWGYSMWAREQLTSQKGAILSELSASHSHCQRSCLEGWKIGLLLPELQKKETVTFCYTK